MKLGVSGWGHRVGLVALEQEKSKQLSAGNLFTIAGSSSPSLVIVNV
jgi:hypothetical protein